MYSVRLFVLLVVAAGGCAIQSRFIPEPFRSVGVTSNGIFTLTVRRADGVAGFYANGTGFFVSPNGCFVSALHIHEFSEKGIASVSGFEGQRVAGIGAMNDSDLALFRLEGAGTVPFLRVVENYYIPHVGEKFLAINRSGYVKPLGAAEETVGMWRLASSLGSGRKRIVFGYRLNGTVGPSDSGSPLLNARGEVVGVIVGYSAETGVAAAVPLFKELLMIIASKKSECIGVP